MMKKAIIDIGTNSTRLLIAEKDENGWRMRSLILPVSVKISAQSR